MSDILAGATNAVSGLANKFSYGHHPSAIMWKSTDVAQEESEDDSFFAPLNSARKSLESLTTSPTLEGFTTFKFDAMMSESHDAQTRVTKVPVSSGFLVSDHIINENRILKLEAVATNLQNSSMWLASVEGLSVVTGAIFNNPVIPAIGGVYGLVTSAFETENRVQSTYKMLNDLRVSGTRLYISTILGTYLNCVITGLRTKNDKMTSAILSIEITLEELQVVEQSDDARAAQTALETSYDYSRFAKVAASMGIGVLGGAPLPGLGRINRPTAQLNVLNQKLDALVQPISSVKGLIL